MITEIENEIIEINLQGGARGLKGDKGDTGETGATGPQGLKGDKGESGVWTGSDEPTSDYDVWIDPNGETIPIPTKTSQLSNDSGYITSASLPTKVSQLENDSGFITKSVNDLTNYTPTTSLSNVATSGNYSDLSGTPNIPTKTSNLQNDSGFIDKDVSNLTNYPTSNNVSTLLSGKQNVVLSGTNAPTNDIGENGDIYLQYEA